MNLTPLEYDIAFPENSGSMGALNALEPGKKPSIEIDETTLDLPVEKLGGVAAHEVTHYAALALAYMIESTELNPDHPLYRIGLIEYHQIKQGAKGSSPILSVYANSSEEQVAYFYEQAYALIFNAGRDALHHQRRNDKKLELYKSVMAEFDCKAKAYM